MNLAQQQNPLVSIEPGESDRTPPVDLDLTKNVYRSPRERIVAFLLGACAIISILTTLAIAVILVYEATNFFTEVSIGEFFTESRWTPQFLEKHFGIWPLVTGTLLITVIAAVVALPLGLASAIYISEYAPAWVRSWLKPSLELLAGVPTVVYGYFALTFVTPLLQGFVPGLNIFNALSAGIVVGIMIIPMVASLSEDALRSVPRSMAEGAYALGATKIEVTLRILVPGAISGIIASFILAISRAIGETMIVALAAGSTAILTFDPRASVQTMTAYIVQISMGDVAQGTVEYRSIFAVAMLLFLMTLVMNLAATALIRRFQERY